MSAWWWLVLTCGAILCAAVGAVAVSFYSEMYDYLDHFPPIVRELATVSGCLVMAVAIVATALTGVAMGVGIAFYMVMLGVQIVSSL